MRSLSSLNRVLRHAMPARARARNPRAPFVLFSTRESGDLRTEILERPTVSPFTRFSPYAVFPGKSAKKFQLPFSLFFPGKNGNARLLGGNYGAGSLFSRKLIQPGNLENDPTPERLGAGEPSQQGACTTSRPSRLSPGNALFNTVFPSSFH